MDDLTSRFAAALAERVADASRQRVALVAAIEETRIARSLTFSDDEHDPDGSLASLDQARDAALLQRTEQTLADLAEARRRLASGTYGTCESCLADIGTERLLARPESRLCLACAGNTDSRRRGG